MQIIEDKIVKEKVYIEKLESGFTIQCVPKKGTKKKYAICGVGYGSNYNHFKIKGTGEDILVPDGVAHYLEHKMFEQESGINSLDTLSALGVDANAYTTNDHTAYLFECTDNFDEALDELLSYIQNPYFTEENVEKERGIISQEINMYDDEPEWKVYINCMKALYNINPIRIDVAGSVESIKKIDKDILYKCYNNFYVADNMILVVVGDFAPEQMINKIKGKIKLSNTEAPHIILAEEPVKINEQKIIEEMDVFLPIFCFGYKINPKVNDKVKRHLAIEIINELTFGESTELYQRLYENGYIYENLVTSFEWSKEEYSHVLIQGKSPKIERVKDEIQKAIEELKENGIEDRRFERAKRKIYGAYIKEFNDVSSIASSITINYFKKVTPFDYIEEYKTISKDYVLQVLKNEYKNENMVESCIIPKS